MPQFYPGKYLDEERTGVGHYSSIYFSFGRRAGVLYLNGMAGL